MSRRKREALGDERPGQAARPDPGPQMVESGGHVGAVDPPREKKETAPPQRARCPHCGGDRMRVAYTTSFREFGFRRVTASCSDCGGVGWWDENV